MTTRPDRCLLLFTKPAVAGRVKTRLTGEGGLSAERAAAVHAAFLGDLVERLLPATVREMRLRVAWAVEEGEAMPELGAVVGEALGAAAGLRIPERAAVDAVRQQGGELGERLFRALGEAAEGHPGGVAAVGSDHPTLPLERVRQAFAALARADVVLGPADDGGYYLVALRPAAVRRRLFAEVPWSTGRVLAATLERCSELGLGVELLPEGHDVDEPADLARLARRLAEPGAAVDCPRTRRLLAAWGRLPEPTAAGSTSGD